MPMRIERVQVDNFEGIEEADIVLGDVTILYGDNGAGKSTIKDAIDTGATGHAPRGRKLPEMIRQGAKSMNIRLHISGDKTMEVRRRRSAGAGDNWIDTKKVGSGIIERKIEETYGVSVAAIGSALRSSELFDLEPEDLQRLLVGLLPSLEVTAARITQAMGEVIAAAATRTKIGLPTTLSLFPDVFKRAEDFRKRAKRQLSACEADLNRLPIPEGDSGKHAADAVEKATSKATDDELAETIAKKKIAAGIEKLRAKREGIVVREAAAAARDVGVLEERKRNIQALIAELEPKTGGNTASEARAELEKVDASIAELGKKDRTLEREVEGLDEKIAKLKEGAEAEADPEIARIDQAIKQLEADLKDAKPKIDAALVERAGEVATELEQLAADITKHKAAHGTIGTEYRAQLAASKKLPDGKAPMCSVYPDTQCPLSTDHFAKLGEKLTAALEATAIRGTEAKEKLGAAEKRKGELEIDQRNIVDAQAREATRGEIAGNKKRRETLKSEAAERAAEAATQREEETKAAQARKETIAQERGTLATETSTLNVQADELRQTVSFGDQVVEAKAKLLESKTELDEVNTELAKPVEQGIATDLTETDKSLAMGAEVIAALDALEERAVMFSKIAKASEDIQDSDKLCKACGPGGVRAKLLTEMTEPFLTAVNTSIAKYAPGYKISIDGEKGLRFWVATPKDSLLDPDQLSDGERQQVLYALQYAVAKLSGCGIMAIDKVELLSPDNRKALRKTAKGWAKNGVQVLMMNNLPPPDDVHRNYVAYAITDGRSARIPTTEKS